MTNPRRRKSEQIVKLLQEGEAMLVARKTLPEFLQKLEVKESTWLRWKKLRSSTASKTKMGLASSILIRSRLSLENGFSK